MGVRKNKWASMRISKNIMWEWMVRGRASDKGENMSMWEQVRKLRIYENMWEYVKQVIRVRIWESKNKWEQVMNSNDQIT